MRKIRRNGNGNDNLQIVGGGCQGCGGCGGTSSPDCLTCTHGGHKCLTERERVVEIPTHQPYSNLGGVIAPINSAYTMPSMSNPNAERPVKRIDTRIPSQTNLGGINTISDFNPYNTLGTYNKDLNTMRNDQRLPKKFGGQFFTNVNLENPSGNPVLKATGVDYGGYLPQTNPIGVGKKKKSCSNKRCEEIRRRGFLGFGRRVAKDWCSGTPPNCTCLGNPCS